MHKQDIANRQSIIQDMVKRATDTNVPSAERIVPILDLCQLYWDTDALLIQACSKISATNHLARVFYVPQDADAIALAMEIRFAVQTQFAFRSMRSSSGPDSLQAQAHVMFRPGLRLKCVQDDCSCSFTGVAMQQITTAVGLSRISEPQMLTTIANKTTQSPARGSLCSVQCISRGWSVQRVL